MCIISLMKYWRKALNPYHRLRHPHCISIALSGAVSSVVSEEPELVKLFYAVLRILTDRAYALAGIA